jgi:hypothetical protein
VDRDSSYTIVTQTPSWSFADRGISANAHHGHERTRLDWRLP